MYIKLCPHFVIWTDEKYKGKRTIMFADNCLFHLRAQGIHQMLLSHDQKDGDTETMKN